MNSKKKEQTLNPPEAFGLDHPVPDLDIDRLRAAQRLMDEVASRIPPLTQEQVYAIISSGRLPQLQLRRQADRHLLTFCLTLLALAASLLWHHASDGLSPLNIVLLIFAAADLWVALRAAYSLWLMRKEYRLRHQPYRMAQYSDRLNRLTQRRRLWVDFVLRSHEVALLSQASYRFEKLFPHIPSPVFVTACLALLVGATAWLVLGSRHSDGDPLLASSHTPPSAAIPMPVPSAHDVPSAIAPDRPMSASAEPQASLGSAQHGPEKSQLADAQQTELPPSHVRENATMAEELLAMEEPMTEPCEQSMDSRLAATDVLCNRGDCSSQHYYELFCSIIMDNN